MAVTGPKSFDVILVSGDYHADHPLCGTGIIARVLKGNGYSVGVIEKPDWKSDADFLRLGKPGLFFGITSGAMDSMIRNYTALKKPRTLQKKKDPDFKPVPDRAVIVYCNKIRQLFKDTPLVIGGVEASLRRFAHYDFWQDTVRKSILFDTRADILSYGNSEYQILEIAKRMKDGQSLSGIAGTAMIAPSVPEGFKTLPSYEDVSADKNRFCKMQTAFSNEKNLAQKTGDRYVLQYKMHPYTQKEVDAVYVLPFSRNIPPHFHELKMAQFSVVTHRGCFGGCNFCAIALHQGKRIISRSQKSITDEIKTITKHKDYKGVIDDLGGPTANMYGMDCGRCGRFICTTCDKLDGSHKKLIRLMKAARKVKGVRKIFIRSGIRFDLAVNSEDYIREIAEHHTSGFLKIAPEHFSEKILKLMNKNSGQFGRFKKMFDKYNRPLKQFLKYYFLAGHPGSTEKDAREQAGKMKQLGNTESVQLFTPTPMSVSTCMYYTGMDPRTGEKIPVAKTYKEREKQKSLMF